MAQAAAIKLFGNLSRFGDGPSREPFAEQIHANIVSLLLHLNDEDGKDIFNGIYACPAALLTLKQ